MAGDKQARRPRAEAPKGFRDYFGAEVSERKAMLDTIAGVYHRYGFDPLETSAVETVEALGKFLPDVERPNAGVFAWREVEQGASRDADWLALRYDLTAPLARVAAQYRGDLPSPYRRYAMGPVWRNEKPGPGRFRQFYQCDADTVGSASVAADAEICMMLADALEAVGIERGDYVIRVNNRKVLNGVMEVAGISDANQQAAVLRTIDKFDKVGEAGVRALLGKGRRDSSGAYIDGVGLDDASAEMVIQFLKTRQRAQDQLAAGKISMLPNFFWHSIFVREHSEEASDVSKRKLSDVATRVRELLDSELGRNRLKNYATLSKLHELVQNSEIGKQGVDELAELADYLGALGYSHDRIVIDPSVVRGLGYYTGPVYEAELTFEILDDKGHKRQFGSVAGGGRYDDLVKRFTGQSVPATGISIGVDRLLAALRAKGRTQADTSGPVVVTVMDRDRMADYQAMAGDLRRAGIRAEVYLGNPKNFGNQLKYADKRNSPVAVIQGADEAARGVLLLKDLFLGARLAAEASHAEWKGQPAQTEVARADLVTGVRRLLGDG